MQFLLLLPFLFFRFWFLEAPAGLVSYFSSLNYAILQLFSLELLLKTFFQPWKNEYRQGLVGFSIGMGMFIKSIFIFSELCIFVLLLGVEMLAVVGFVALPVLTIFLLLQ